MKNFKITRSALGLYGVLFVAPTLIFAWLYWRELERNFVSEQQSLPQLAERHAGLIVQEVRGALDRLLESEAARPFTNYSDFIFPQNQVSGEAQALKSPLTTIGLPVGIEAWFSFQRGAEPDADIEVFLGSDDMDRSGRKADLISVLEEFRLQSGDQYLLPSAIPPRHNEEVALANLAILMESRGDLSCVLDCYKEMAGKPVGISVSDFQVQFYRDEFDNPRLVASRRIDDNYSHLYWPTGFPCIEQLQKGFHVQQGFLIDPNWLFRQLPNDIAKVLLDDNESLSLINEVGPISDVELPQARARISPVADLGLDVFEETDRAFDPWLLHVDSQKLIERHERQQSRLLGVAVMLVLTLGLGMTLLYRAVDRELEQAHRMQNFVAAVTHELRTPVATIRLHGEMLQDGWVSDEEMRNEYYARIVRETGRLSTLVENVLQKSKLTESASEKLACDLNEVTERVTLGLMQGVSEDDLELSLGASLPKVWLTPECIPGILSSLVENARKYASVPPGGEKILVSTRVENGKAILEVSDRGPGVPAKERDQVFEAFYRVGSEATRTSTGTGLGLHLVRLHCESSGAKASIHDREGGGSIFRICLASAG